MEGLLEQQVILLLSNRDCIAGGHRLVNC